MSLFGFEDDLDVEVTDIAPITDDGKRCPNSSIARQLSPEQSKPTVLQVQELLIKDLIDEFDTDNTLQDTENTSSIFEETVTASTPQPRRVARKPAKDETKSTATACENSTSEMEVTESHIMDDSSISSIDDATAETNEIVPLRTRPVRAAARKKYGNFENERSLSTINVTSSIYDPKIRKTKTKSKHTARKNCENDGNVKSVSFSNDVTQSESRTAATRAYNAPARPKKILQSVENTINENSIEPVKPPTKKKYTKKIPKAKLEQNAIVEKKAEQINNQFKLVEEYQLCVE